MSLTVLVVFQLLGAFVFVACAAQFLCALPHTIEETRWKRIVAWIGYGLLSYLIPMWFANDVITFVILSMYYLSLAYLLYLRSKMAAVCQLIYMAVMMLTQYMAIFLAVEMREVFTLDLITFQFLITVFKALFLLAVTVVMYQVVSRRFRDPPYLKVRGMVLVPLLSFGLLFLYTISSEVFLIRYGYQWILLFCVMLLVMNLYCLYFWYDVAKNRELRYRLDMMEQQNDMTIRYYEEMERNYSESRKVIHDIRNHLHAMEKKYEIERSKYMNDVHTMLNSMGMKFYTENQMLNIILNDKLKEIPSEQVDCNLGGVGLEFLSDMDVTTIFANLLENAIEERKEQKSFFLKIRANKIQDFTVVKISNPMSGSYSEGVSGKPGHQGIGLQNVRKTVEKHHGEMEIQTENGMFSVVLVFGERGGI